MVYIVDGLMV